MIYEFDLWILRPLGSLRMIFSSCMACNYVLFSGISVNQCLYRVRRIVWVVTSNERSSPGGQSWSNRNRNSIWIAVTIDVHKMQFCVSRFAFSFVTFGYSTHLQNICFRLTQNGLGHVGLPNKYGRIQRSRQWLRSTLTLGPHIATTAHQAWRACVLTLQSIDVECSRKNCVQWKTSTTRPTYYFSLAFYRAKQLC